MRKKFAVIVTDVSDNGQAIIYYYMSRPVYSKICYSNHQHVWSLEGYFLLLILSFGLLIFMSGFVSIKFAVLINQAGWGNFCY